MHTTRNFPSRRFQNDRGSQTADQGVYCISCHIGARYIHQPSPHPPWFLVSGDLIVRPDLTGADLHGPKSCIVVQDRADRLLTLLISLKWRRGNAFERYGLYSC